MIERRKLPCDIEGFAIGGGGGADESDVRGGAGERREERRRLEARDLPGMPLGQEGKAVSNEEEVELSSFTGGCDLFKDFEVLAARRGARIAPAGDVVAGSHRIYPEVHLPLTHVPFLFC